jgi:hypothetical protein
MKNNAYYLVLCLLVLTGLLFVKSLSASVAIQYELMTGKVEKVEDNVITVGGKVFYPAVEAKDNLEVSVGDQIKILYFNSAGKFFYKQIYGSNEEVVIPEVESKRGHNFN